MSLIKVEACWLGHCIFRLSLGIQVPAIVDRRRHLDLINIITDFLAAEAPGYRVQVSLGKGHSCHEKRKEYKGQFLHEIKFTWQISTLKIFFVVKIG